MKRTFLKNCAKLCLLSAAAYGTYLYACADGFMGYDYNSVFSPEVTVSQKSYTPLFYDSNYLFYGNNYIDKQSRDFSQTDIQNWSEYLGKALSKEKIKYFLYDEKALPEIQKSSSTDKKVQRFFSLLTIARGNEFATNQPYDPWDYDSRKVAHTQQGEINKAEALYQDALKDKDEFFAHRMWYQVLRLKFYSANRSSVIDYFKQTEGAQPRTDLYYRAMHYVAGAYIAQKDYIKSTPLLAQILNKVPTLRQIVTYEYRPLSAEQLGELTSGLSTQEQCALWAMDGYYNSEKDAIEKILSLDSQSPYTDFLLSRYINRLESKINIFDAYGEAINSYKSYHEHTRAIATLSYPTNWILSTAKDKKVANPYLWQVAAGYVAMFRNEFNEARSFLSKAEKVADSPAKKAQVRLISLFNEVSALERITPQAEQKLLKELPWLWEYKAPEGQEALRSGYAIAFIGKYLSMLYKTENNPLMAELTHTIKGYYRKEELSVAMEQFLLKKNKTSWETFWAKKYQYTLNDIYESKAIHAFYEDKLPEAIALMKKTPQEKAILPANPFNGKIKDCADCEHALPQKVKYSKLSFLEKVKEMEDKIAKKEDIYNNALLVGNAFYNASYFGSVRFFYYNSIIDEYSYRVSPEYWDVLLNMKQAKKYYLLAKEYASNDEQKARIIYMLAKVERNEYYNKNFFCKDEYTRESLDKGLHYRWEAFEELRGYAHTKYYQEVIAECGYFKRFVD